MTSQTAIQRIRHMGLIAVVRGDWPVDELLAIGDALLAAPILVMAVTLQGVEAVAAIAALRTRFGRHVLIGAGAVETPVQADDAVSAGAQFLLASQLDQAVVRRTRLADVLYLPTVQTLTEAQKAAAVGCRLVAAADPHFVAHLRSARPKVEVVAGGRVDLTNMAAYAHAGALAVCVAEALLPAPLWSQAALITAARQLRTAWEAALHGRKEPRP